MGLEPSAKRSRDIIILEQPMTSLKTNPVVTLWGTKPPVPPLRRRRHKLPTVETPAEPSDTPAEPCDTPAEPRDQAGVNSSSNSGSLVVLVEVVEVATAAPCHGDPGMLAVDLSLWVCEAQHVQAMMGRVTKPHLRNLFFRVSSLTLMGVKLVFMIEGDAPRLKAETMKKRTTARYGVCMKGPAPTSTSRGRLKAVLREWADMLDCLGVPWVTAAGDAHSLVDGCITNDGEAFLYGARTVYRNFNMNSKVRLHISEVR
ncbi:flap endonuclease GEN homolog 1-like [Brachionichthys hirsutus]|uniref:flap endonuclease GEN homolog 1-like n=1 Tax=Brachionichthys hirsutus TaxID=412623 RepID=UPI0036047205